MDKLTKDILGLPPKNSIVELDNFYFEIQEAVGGAGSSKRLAYSVLAQAILDVQREHGDLAGLDDDDHPQYLNEQRADARYVPLSHLSDENPHPQYQTEVEVDAQVDAKITALKQEVDPFTQYATEAQLAAQVEAAIDTIAPAIVAEKVQNYIDDESEPLVAAVVNRLHILEQPVPVAGVVTLDAATASYFYIELTENIQLVLINPPAPDRAQTFYIQFKQDAVGGHTVTLPAEFVPNKGSRTTVDPAPDSYTDLAATTLNSGLRWSYAMQGAE